LDPQRTDVEEVPTSGVLIVRIREDLNFANSSQLQERLQRIELFGAEHTKRHPSDDRIRDQTRIIVFDMCDVDDCDAAAIQIFSEIIQEYKNRSVGVYLTSLGWLAYQKFVKAGVFQILDESCVLGSVEEAMKLIERTVEVDVT
jgi:MFS superfamily sulfate permease-like transporter